MTTNINLSGTNRFTVSNDFSTGSFQLIQDAINAAPPDSTILLLPGTYTENLTISQGLSIVGFGDVGQGNIVITGNASIVSASGTVSFENITMTATSGITLDINMTTAGTTNAVAIDNCVISNTDVAGTAVRAISGNSTNTLSLDIRNSNISSSGIGISAQSTTNQLMIFVRYTEIQAVTGIDAGANVLCNAFWDFLFSTGNVFKISDATGVINCADSFGFSSSEFLIFTAAGSGIVANSGFRCDAVSGFWATGTGNLTYSSVGVLGTATAIDPSTTTTPIFSQPSSTGITAQAIGTSQTLVNNNAYYVTSGDVTLALPAASPVGSVLTVCLSGGIGWLISQAAGQQIIYGTSTSTLGTSGSLSSIAAGDCATLNCIVSDTIWQVISTVGTPVVV